MPAMPQPYRRTELRGLRTTLDERWPTLPPEEADRWLRRVKDGRAPYSRVRVHAIRSQLDCIVALASTSAFGARRFSAWTSGVSTTTTTASSSPTRLGRSTESADKSRSPIQRDMRSTNGSCAATSSTPITSSRG